MHKYVLAAAFVALTSTACLAAQEFYVVQDVKTKACKIASDKPDGVEKIMIGTSPYATRPEAKAAKKASPICNPPGQ